MGLENLKSAYSNIEPFNRKDIRGNDSSFDDLVPYDKIELTSLTSVLNVRDVDVDIQSLTAKKLGIGDLKFDTLYNSDHTSKTDDRLNIRFGDWGYRTSQFNIKEPYYVTSIKKDGDKRLKESALATYDIHIGPIMRSIGFMSSNAGISSMLYRGINQYFNRRTNRIFNPLDWIPIDITGEVGGIGIDVESIMEEFSPVDFRFGPGTKYTDTVFEFGGTEPTSIKAELLTFPNISSNKIPLTPFSGGVAFQVLGKNASKLAGRTMLDFTNVAPNVPTSILDIFGSFSKIKLFEAPKIEDAGPAGGFGKLGDLSKVRSFDLSWHTSKRMPPPKLGEETPTKQTQQIGPYSTIHDPIAVPLTTHNKYTEDYIPGYPAKLGTGDPFTTLPISDYDPHNRGAELGEVEKEEYGMPFYFKDLRDDSYIIFRAYITGLTEDVAPSWSPENYIGRSSPVYVYERAERTINYTLDLFAHTEGELESIYQKLNRLTSMCYPEYKRDTTFPEEGKIRMKPPLVRFRMGELFGGPKKELLGFISSLSYVYPDTSTWETKKGRRIPKHVQSSISFTVIHEEVPSLDFAREKSGIDGVTNVSSFYGTILSDGGVGRA